MNGGCDDDDEVATGKGVRDSVSVLVRSTFDHVTFGLTFRIGLLISQTCWAQLPSAYQQLSSIVSAHSPRFCSVAVMKPAFVGSCSCVDGAVQEFQR